MVGGSRHGDEHRQRMSGKQQQKVHRVPPSRSFTVPPLGSRPYWHGKEAVGGSGEGASSVPVPNYFICPISLEIMADPVTLCTGQTYDRENIVRWIESGHRTCPATGQPLGTLELIPNHMLRNLLEEWALLNERIGVQAVASPKAAADPRQVDDLLQQIKEAPLKYEAVKKLHGLAGQSIKNQVQIVEQGAVAVLASILYSQAKLEMEAVRAARRAAGASTDKDQSSPERLVQEDQARNLPTEVASTSSPSAPPDLSPSTSAASSAAPSSTRELEIVELPPEELVRQVSSRPVAPRSPLRRSAEEEDAMEQRFVGYLCFPLGRRKHAVRPYVQPPAWSMPAKNSGTRGAGKGTDHRQLEAVATASSSVGNVMSEGETSTRLQEGSSKGSATSADLVDAPRLSDGERDALLACEEALDLLNLLPLAHDERQVIMAITDQGTTVTWFLRSEAQMSMKLKALRLLRNLLNLEELRPVLGSRQSIFVRLLRFVRHDLHPEGLKLVFEILLLLCTSGASCIRNAVEAGTIEALLDFLDSQTVTIANSRNSRAPLIDNRLPLAKPDATPRPGNLLGSPTSSAHSHHYIDRTVALAIAHSLKDRASKSQPFSAAEEIMVNKEVALFVLEKLVANNAAGLAIAAKVKVGVPTLVWHLGKISPHATEVCATLLVALCGAESSSTTADVELAREAAIQAGAINQLVFVVQSGTLRTRQCAAQLLKVLHWKPSSCSPSES